MCRNRILVAAFASLIILVAAHAKQDPSPPPSPASAAQQPAPDEGADIFWLQARAAEMMRTLCGEPTGEDLVVDADRRSCRSWMMPGGSSQQPADSYAAD